MSFPFDFGMCKRDSSFKFLFGSLPMPLHAKDKETSENGVSENGVKDEVKEADKEVVKDEVKEVVKEVVKDDKEADNLLL